MISLREGRPLPLPHFLSSEMGGRLKLGAFNLQDPFELSHNVAANVNEKTALRFRRCCSDAAKYCRSLQYQRKSSKGKIWGLVRLFQPGTPEAETPAPDNFVLCLPLTLAALPVGIHERLCQAGDFPQQWFQKVCDSVAAVFQEVLKCSFSEKLEPAADSSVQEEEQMEEEAETVAVGSKHLLAREDGDSLSPPSKKLRVDALPAAPESRTWVCAAWHPVWVGRRRVRRQLRGPQPDPQEQVDTLGLEVKVSEAIAQQEGKARPAAPLLQFTVCAQTGGSTSIGHDTRISLSFAPVSAQAASFLEFFHFLEAFLPRMVELHLASNA